MSKLRSRRSGMSLVEMLVVLVILLAIAFVGFYLVVYCTIFAGNFWIQESGALKEVQKNHPEAVSVVDLDRSIWSATKVEVENQDGTRSTYWIDTSILQDHELVEEE